MPDATRGDPTSVEGSACYLGATFDDKRSDDFLGEKTTKESQLER